VLEKYPEGSDMSFSQLEAAARLQIESQQASQPPEKTNESPDGKKSKTPKKKIVVKPVQIPVDDEM